MDNEKVFNVLHLTDVESSGVINVSVSTLGGIYIGGWESDNGQISNIDSSYEDPGTDQHKISLKRWWRCVSDCIGDAIWACGTSRECISLLFLADVGTIPYMGPAGAFLGRRMIAIACSASCADNVNLDLIPEH